MFVRMLAVNPHKVTRPHLMSEAFNPYKAPTPQAKDQLMSRKMIPLHVMVRPRQEMPASGNRVKNLLMRRTRRSKQ